MENVKNNERLIYRKPVDEIIKNIEKSNEKSILLAGDISTGKTVVLNELLKKESYNYYIDGTVKNVEFLIHPDQEVFELYHVCLLLKKMLNYTKENFRKEYFYFMNLDRLVDFLYNQTNYMYVTDNYKNKYSMIDEYILKNPEVLIENYLSIASKIFDVKSIRIVIDNFDAIGHSSKKYQIYMYNLLKNYLNFILTVSDRTAMNNKERVESLKESNEIINVNYSKSLEDVKKIIEVSFKNEMIRFDKGNITTNINFILSDLEIALMIEKTNGNLFDILNAIRYLYSNINSLNREDYGKFVLNYIDKEINKNPIISGRIMPERILHIK